MNIVVIRMELRNKKIKIDPFQSFTVASSPLMYSYTNRQRNSNKFLRLVRKRGTFDSWDFKEELNWCVTLRNEHVFATLYDVYRTIYRSVDLGEEIWRTFNNIKCYQRSPAEMDTPKVLRWFNQSILIHRGYVFVFTNSLSPSSFPPN